MSSVAPSCTRTCNMSNKSNIAPSNMSSVAPSCTHTCNMSNMSNIAHMQYEQRGAQLHTYM